MPSVDGGSGGGSDAVCGEGKGLSVRARSAEDARAAVRAPPSFGISVASALAALWRPLQSSDRV